MYSTELIRKFPDNPSEPVLYVVYNKQHINEAEYFIALIHGTEYLDNHVKIVPFDEPFEKNGVNYQVYIDPLVFKYKNSWNN